MCRNLIRPRRLRPRNGQRAILSCAGIVILSVATIWTCGASPTFGTRHHTLSDSIGAPILPWKRKIQSWLIRNRSQSRVSAAMRQRIKHSSTKKHDAGRTQKRGSFMTNERPTKQRLYRWFGVEGEDPNQFMRCMILRNEFNHDITGITNPFLKVRRSSEQDATIVSTNSELDCDGQRSSRPSDLTPAVTLSSNEYIENSWWPSLQITQNKDRVRDGIQRFKKWGILQGNRNNRNGIDEINSGFREQDWRILTYRKRVGKGRDCYRKIRDAALDWEFQSTDGSIGMMQVPETSPRAEYNKLKTIPVASSKRKRSYSVRPIDAEKSDANRRMNAYSSSSSLFRSLGSRRLVSFASKSITDFLPSFLRQRIYSINPVMVVYDVVDQRAPDGQTTFTSTAYATLKGHFLRGEERVTVALRDGSQDVEVEIFSISRAGAGLLGKALWPFIGKMQSDFFQQQLNHLSQTGVGINVDDPTGRDANRIPNTTQVNRLLH